MNLVEKFFDHVANGRLACVQRMVYSGIASFAYPKSALALAAERGHTDVVDCLIQTETDFPDIFKWAAGKGYVVIIERLFQDTRVDLPAVKNHAVQLAAANGHLAVVERLLQDERVDPAAMDNDAVRSAAENGHLAVVERLLQDARVDPSADDNDAIRFAAANGHVAVVDRLLQDERVDPAAGNNYAARWSAYKGHLAVVERLLQDERVDPSADNNHAVRWAAYYSHLAVVDRLLEDSRVDVAVAILYSLPKTRKRFECRERLTSICIAMQAMRLPAWVTVQILDASCPWSTLPLHSKWNLACAVKHFHDRRE